MTNQLRRIVLCGSLVGFIFAHFLGNAAAQTWNATDGDWSDGSKWSGGSPPVSSTSTILGFPGVANQSYTSNHNLGNSFQLFAIILNHPGNGVINLTGDSLEFQGPNAGGQSAIQQDGSGLAVIQNNLSVTGNAMTLQGVGEGGLQFDGAVQGSAIVKLNPINSLVEFTGGTGGGVLNALVSRSGEIRIRGSQLFEVNSLGIGDLGTVQSSMHFLDGATVINNGQLLIANQAGGSSSSHQISGLGTQFDQAGSVFVGNAGDGSLLVTDNATMNVAGQIQIGNLSGSSSAFSVDSGASVNAANTTRLGVEQGAYGNYTIDNASVVAATNSGASFSVGFSGGGDLDIIAGGTLTVGNPGNLAPFENEIVAGQNSTGEGRIFVRDAGSKLTSTNAVLGFSGDGRLRATENSLVEVSGLTVLGYNSGSYGEVLVGDNAVFTSNELQIGRSGIGSFSVFGSGNVAIAETTFLAPLVGGNGALFIAEAGSSMQTGSLFVGGQVSGSSLLSGGEARVEVSTSGSLIVANDLVLFEQGIVRITDSAGMINVGTPSGVNGALNVGGGGKLAGIGLIEANVRIGDAGILLPGLNGVGTLQIDGNLDMFSLSNAAVYGWDLADAGAATDVLGGSSSTALHDRLIVNSGTISLSDWSIIVSELGAFSSTFDSSQSYSWKLMEITGVGDIDLFGVPQISFLGSSDISSAVNSNLGSLSLAIGNSGGTNQFLALNYISAVPEPSSLLLVGGLGLTLILRRQGRK